MEMSEYQRLAARTTDENLLNKMCTMGISEKFGRSRMLGARHGRNFNDDPCKLYDYVYLKEQYDR